MGKLEKLDTDQQNSIVEKYQTGESMAKIAKQFSCTGPTVATFLRKKGVAIRTKAAKEAYEQEVEQAYAEHTNVNG